MKHQLQATLIIEWLQYWTTELPSIHLCL